MTHLIEVAVAPLKADAMDRAEQNAKKTVAYWTKKLVENDFDAQKVAPYPKSFGSEYKGKLDYQEKLRDYRQLHCLVQIDYVRCGGCRRPNDPEYVKINDELVAKFIEDARKMAASQYEMFVGKLIHKIGDVTEAILEGNHVWGYSFLNIVKPDGEKQIWKTHMITNVSKLGTYFNQWPTRKVKNKI